MIGKTWLGASRRKASSEIATNGIPRQMFATISEKRAGQEKGGEGAEQAEHAAQRLREKNERNPGGAIPLPL